MQMYGSFQSVSNLLRLIQTDYSLADDLTSKYLGSLESAFPSAGLPQLAKGAPLIAPIATAVAAPAKAPKKPRKQQVHVPGTSCCGTNRHSKLCCNARLKDSTFCRWHQDQLANPVVPAPTVDPNADVQSFSVHTPPHSRRPSVSSPDPTRAQAQEKFSQLATDRCNSGHLVKQVTLAGGSYIGVGIKLDNNFVCKQMFTDAAKSIGLFLAEVDDHLTPCGYMPEGDEEVADSVVHVVPTQMPSLSTHFDGDDDAESVVPNTPIYHTDTEDEEAEAESEDFDLTEDTFQSMADSCGLTDEVDNNANSDDAAYYPFGIYISSFEDNTENLDLLQKNLSALGYSTKITEDYEDEDEKYMLIQMK